MYFQKKGTLSMQSGTVFGQESPCGRQYGLLHTLLWNELGQEGVGRRKDHVLRFGDKEIEEWHGTHHGFSMWREDGVSIQGEIVPGQLRRDRVVWVRVS